MSLISHKDFASTSGQDIIITVIHRLEAKIHELEKEVKILQREERQIEQELQGPEAY
jgi:hypothetical protein